MYILGKQLNNKSIVISNYCIQPWCRINVSIFISFILLQHDLEGLPTQLWFYYVPTKQAAVKSFNITVYIPSKSERIPSRWSFTESSDILSECRGLRDFAFSQIMTTVAILQESNWCRIALWLWWSAVPVRAECGAWMSLWPSPPPRISAARTRGGQGAGTDGWWAETHATPGKNTPLNFSSLGFFSSLSRLAEKPFFPSMLKKTVVKDVLYANTRRTNTHKLCWSQ